MIFNYKIEGRAQAGQTWETSGSIELETFQLGEAADRALAESFRMLTRGKAVYGLPGVGCSGPYQVTKVVMEIKR